MVIQNIILNQSVIYLVMKRISSKQRRHVKPLLLAVLTVTRDTNSGITVASGRETKTNQKEGIIM